MGGNTSGSVTTKLSVRRNGAFGDLAQRASGTAVMRCRARHTAATFKVSHTENSTSSSCNSSPSTSVPGYGRSPCLA